MLLDSHLVTARPALSPGGVAMLGLRSFLCEDVSLPVTGGPRPRAQVILDIARGDSQLGHAPGEVGLESERRPVMLDAAGHVALGCEEVPEEEVSLGLSITDGQSLPDQPQRLVNVAELVEEGAEVSEDEVPVGDGDLRQGEAVTSEAGPRVTQDPPVGAGQEVKEPRGPGARLLNSLDPCPKLGKVFRHVDLPERDKEPRPRVLIRNLVLGDGGSKAWKVGVLGGELDLGKLLLIAGGRIPGQGVGTGGGQIELIVHHTLQVKPLVVGGQIDGGQTGPLRVPGHVGHALIMAGPTRPLVHSELVVISKLGIPLLLSGLGVVSLQFFDLSLRSIFTVIVHFVVSLHHVAFLLWRSPRKETKYREETSYVCTGSLHVSPPEHRVDRNIV